MTLIISWIGMPSVMQTIKVIPPAAASMIASAANGGGTKIPEALAPVALTASATVLKTGTPMWVVPPPKPMVTADYPFFELSWSVAEKERRYVTKFDSTFTQRKDVAHATHAADDALQRAMRLRDSLEEAATRLGDFQRDARCREKRRLDALGPLALLLIVRLRQLHRLRDAAVGGAVVVHEAQKVRAQVLHLRDVVGEPTVFRLARRDARDHRRERRSEGARVRSSATATGDRSIGGQVVAERA